MDSQRNCDLFQTLQLELIRNYDPNRCTSRFCSECFPVSDVLLQSKFKLEWCVYTVPIVFRVCQLWSYQAASYEAFFFKFIYVLVLYIKQKYKIFSKVALLCFGVYFMKYKLYNVISKAGDFVQLFNCFTLISTLARWIM